MSDDFLAQFRRWPRREFADQLYERISQAESAPEAAPMAATAAGFRPDFVDQNSAERGGNVQDRVVADYESLAQISNQFGQRADELNAMVNRLVANVDNLRGGGWIGAGANSFYQEMDGEILPALQRLHQAYMTAQSTAQSVSSELARAEGEAQACVAFTLG